MARRYYTPTSVKKMLPYLPIFAAFYAVYEYFVDVGWEGLLADIEAFLTIDNLKSNIGNIIVGALIFLLGNILASKVRDLYMSTLIKTIAYYVGARKIAQTLDEGSTTTGSTSLSSLKTTVSTAWSDLANAFSY